MSEYIQRFSGRDYIFYSDADRRKAEVLYLSCNGSLDLFEQRLGDERIEFCYELE